MRIASRIIWGFWFCISLALWTFFFANVARASDCPPDDPSRIDCAAAARTAENPMVPATGTLAGTGTSLVIDRIRNRRRPRPNFQPPKDYGPGRTNVWDPPIDEQRHKWEEGGLIWDPLELTWRPPRPGEIPPPPDAPENPPPYAQQHPRERVPPDCLNFYDDYVSLQARLIELETEIKSASEAQFDAQLKFNQLLAKFSLKFGYDLADTVIAAKAVAELTVHLGGALMNMLPRALSEALETARSVFRRASDKVSEVTNELGDATRAAASRAKVAEEAADAAKSLKSVAEEAANAASEADEAAKAAQAAVKEAEDALANATTDVDKLKAERALLEAQKAAVDGQAELYKQWQSAYLDYLRRKPGAGVGGPFYQEAFKLEMLGHDIGNAKSAIANLRSLPNPSPGQLQQLANLESQLSGFTNQASSLKQVMDNAAKAFYGVDDVGKISESFMNQHLNDALRQSMGDDAFARYAASSGEDLVNAANKATEIEGKLAGVGKQLDPLMEEARKAGTKVADVVKQAEKAQTAMQKIAPEAAEKSSEAVQAESQAATAAQQATEAQNAVTTTEAAKNAAQQEASVAESALKNVEAQAQEHVKNHFAESPDDVAKVLMGARNDVQRIVDALKNLQSEYDEVLKTMKETKPKLDACESEHSM